MTREERLRRVALLCCHCLRNLSYYRAGWRDGHLVRNDDFWKTANNNFLDIGVLEWCKLFGDTGDRHHWTNVVTDEARFLAGLPHETAASAAEFDTYISEMRRYRDKFIAHLDNDLVMHIPALDIAAHSISYLYGYLRAHEDAGNGLQGFPASAAEYSGQCSREAERVYQD